MKSYNNITNYCSFEENLNSINSYSACKNHICPHIHGSENRNINTIVNFFTTYCICDIHSQSRGESINQIYENGANQPSLFSKFKHNSERDRHGAIDIHDENSDTEWISTLPEYYNVKKANIAPMRDYNFETTYQHNKKTGRILRYYICKYDNCNRRFNKTWNFIDHVRIHTGEKPYICSQCGKGFTQKGNYNKHMTLHASAQD